MPVVHECAREDCKTLTMGELCLEHERGDEQLDAILGASVRSLVREMDSPPKVSDTAA